MKAASIDAANLPGELLRWQRPPLREDAAMKAASIDAANEFLAGADHEANEWGRNEGRVDRRGEQLPVSGVGDQRKQGLWRVVRRILSSRAVSSVLKVRVPPSYGAEGSPGFEWSPDRSHISDYDRAGLWKGWRGAHELKALSSALLRFSEIDEGYRVDTVVDLLAELALELKELDGIQITDEDGILHRPPEPLHHLVNASKAYVVANVVSHQVPAPSPSHLPISS